MKRENYKTDRGWKRIPKEPPPPKEVREYLAEVGGQRKTVVTDEVRAYMAAIGRIGGAPKKLTPKQLSDKMRRLYKSVPKAERSEIAAKGGRAGSAARNAALSPERRQEIARAAVQARWAKAKEKAK